MRINGFSGPPYTQPWSQTVADRCVNLYPERQGDAVVLIGRPGLALDTDLGTGAPVRGLFSQDGRTFAVSGTGFFEYFGPGAVIRRGSVAIDTRPAPMFSNGLAGNQLFFVTGGLGYLFTLSSNAFATVASGFPAGAVMGGHMDGYFFVLTENGRFLISALNNGATWDAADVARRSQGSDTWASMLLEPPNLWLWGSQTGEPWYNNGASDFPFAAIPNVFLEVGVAAIFSPVEIGQEKPISSSKSLASSLLFRNDVRIVNASVVFLTAQSFP